MRSLRLGLIGVLLCGAAATAADREFKDIVRAISDEYHTKPLHIPLFGLVNTVVFVARPGGAKQLDLAVFEDLDTGSGGTVAFSERLRTIVGRSWQPFVHISSRHNGREETTLIYMRPEGRDWKMLITTLEPHEATVVELKLSIDSVRRWMDDPVESADHRGDGQ